MSNLEQRHIEEESQQVPKSRLASLFEVSNRYTEAIRALLLLVAATGTHAASHQYRTVAQNCEPLQSTLKVLDGIDYIQGAGSSFPWNYYNGDPYSWDK